LIDGGVNVFDVITIPNSLKVDYSQKYKTVIVDKWSDVKSIFNNASEQWIFRGQTDSSWGLSTTLDRFKNRVISDASIEASAIALFKEKAKEYEKVTKYGPRTTVEWLYIMQHYGLPTTLLDWTFSPFVASFFAFRDLVPYQPSKDQPSNVAIWAVNQKWCKHRALERIRMIDGYSATAKTDDLTEENAFNDIFLDCYKHDLHFVYPIVSNSERFFERIIAQKGLFLRQGNTFSNFEDNLFFEEENLSLGADRISELIDEREKFIVKFIIPGIINNDVMNDLKTQNITMYTMFNSLDQYAADIVRKLGQLDQYSKGSTEDAIKRVK